MLWLESERLEEGSRFARGEAGIAENFIESREARLTSLAVQLASDLVYDVAVLPAIFDIFAVGVHI